MRKFLTAPAVIARTTSFTEPPRAFLIILMSSRGISVQSNLRFGPMSGFRGVRSEGVSHPDLSDEMAAIDLSIALSVISWASWTRSRMLDRPSTTFLVILAVSATASCVGVGAFRGFHSGASSIVESGTTFNRTVVRSTPETPSIMQWWILAMMANRSSETFDHPQFPEWLVPVELVGHDAPRECLELLVGAGLGQ